MLANAAAASASSETGSASGSAAFNPLNPNGARRNSLTVAASGGGGGGGTGVVNVTRRLSAGSASGSAAPQLPHNMGASTHDTAVLTQIAIAMQNDPALAGQLRAIVGGGDGGAAAPQAV